MNIPSKTTGCYTRLLKSRNNFELQFLEMVFHFFSKQVVLQTENGNQLPATQKQMTKHPQYDILYVKTREMLPQRETNVAKSLLILSPKRRMT